MGTAIVVSIASSMLAAVKGEIPTAVKSPLMFAKYSNAIRADITFPQVASPNRIKPYNALIARSEAEKMKDDEQRNFAGNAEAMSNRNDCTVNNNMLANSR